MLFEAERLLRDFRQRTAPLAPPSANDSEPDLDHVWETAQHEHPRGLL